ITYTENGIIKTAAVEIAVAPKTLQSVTITHAPDTTAYTEGQTFSAAGLVITANYEFLTAVVTNYTIDKTSPLTPADTVVTVASP
ncbi:MAG: hypothetical protein LBE09_02525, partial [Christensenellaceae bacterium]|nr:hypothetical protein [Christensenellaceae bacterium]